MSLQTRLAALVSAIGTDIKTLTTGVAQAEKRAVLVPDTDSTVDEASAVVWKRTSDGAYVASTHVQGQGTTPNRSYMQNTMVDAESGGSGFATISHQARVVAGGARRAAIINLSATAASRSVRAQAENNSGGLQDKLIIDSAGRSDFIQKGARLDLTNQSANIAFTGLDGETDMAYELIMMGSLNPNGASGRNMSVVPRTAANALTPGMTTLHRHWRNNDGSQGHDTLVALDAGCVIGRSDFDTTVGSYLAKMIIGTKVRSDGRRMFSAEWSYIPATTFAVMHGHAGGVYYGTGSTDPITSLELNFNSQIFTGVVTLKALM